MLLGVRAWGACWFAGILLLSAAAAAQTVTVEKVEIRGNRRIPEDTIRFYIQTRGGDPFNPQRLELDLRSLYKANFFESIEVQERDGDTGKVVTFIVKEKPLIRSIEYRGNKSFTESNILEHFKTRRVGLTVDSQYDPAKIRLAERALKELMEQNGKPLGTVRGEIEQIPPSSVRVRFVLDEGPKVRIGQIRFAGEKVFEDDRLRRALKLTKERGLRSIFKGTDKYHRPKLEADTEMNLRAFYKERGYIQVQVGEPVTRIFEGTRGLAPMFRKTKQQFYLEIPIEAGEQYRLGKLELTDCGVIPCENLVKAFGLASGDIVNLTRIKDALEQIKKAYGDLGYINWSYLPEQSLDPKTRTMDLKLTLQPDKQFSVNHINFSGNTKTRDKVLRREFLLEEGRIFSQRALDFSILRLNQLGFFEKVEEKDYEVKPNDKTGLVDVSLKVKERSQQSIGLTGGVSGLAGSFLGLNYTTNNFRGRGETLEFSINGGTRSTDFRVAFTEPYLLDSRWTLGLSVFHQRLQFDTFGVFGALGLGEPRTTLFSQRTSGFSVTTSHPVGRSLWRLGASYSYQSISIGRIAPGFETFALGQLAGFAPSADSDAARTGIIRSEITPTLSYNSTNHFFNPTRGTSVNLSVAFAGGPLGGDFKLVRPAVEYRHFFPDRWLTRGRNTFGLRLLGEYVRAYGGSTVPFFDRFFVGGETTIRGFDIRSISPLAISSTPRLDALGSPIIDQNTGLARIDRSVISIGGDTLAVFNGEYRIPIAGPLSVSAFYDAGLNRASRNRSLGNFGSSTVDILGSTNNVLRSSTGVEIQFLLPVVSAPFRLIFAYNPNVFDGVVTVGTTPIRAREPRRDIKFTIGRSF